jgi:chitinase
VIGSGYAKVGYFVQWGIYGRQYFVKNLVTTGAGPS